MVKRELEDDEKILTTKVLIKNKEELNHLKLLEEYNTFMIDKMLYSNFLEKLRQHKKNGKDLKAEIEMLELRISTSEDQLENGVEVKEKEDKDAPVGVN